MRHGTGTAHFDTSDDIGPPPIDTLDGILNVAGSVLEDYGPDPGGTRIERMARWITFNVGAPPCFERAGGLARFHCAQDVKVERCGILVGIDARTQVAPLLADDAREVAAALLRAAEMAEE